MTRVKLTPAEKEQRKHTRSAHRKNAKIKAAIPLFADQVPEHTAEGEYWHWRFNKAKAAERVGMMLGEYVLDDICLLAIRRLAKALIGEAMYARLLAYFHDTYPDRYQYSFWAGVLTGKRVELRYERVGEPNRYGVTPIRCAEWYEQRHMTRDEFQARFPHSVDPSPPFEDDGLIQSLNEMFARYQRGNAHTGNQGLATGNAQLVVERSDLAQGGEAQEA